MQLNQCNQKVVTVPAAEMAINADSFCNSDLKRAGVD